jgi:pSer/pThr/pTyr-binding forkhead associated (FHA) protein
MRRLIIRSGPLENREFPLQPGTIHIGRAFANDIQIEEPSVSSSHCNIVVGEDAVTIIDLNSTNGTFVNQAQVQSARLKAGDALQFGNVECVFVADAPVARPTVRIASSKPAAEPPPVGVPPPPAIRVAASVGLPPEPPRIAPPLPPPVAAPGVPEAAWCKNHPRSPELYYCTKCHRAFCELCVAVRHTGHVPTHNCRLCASDCVPLTGRPEAPGMKITSFYSALPQSFA